MRNRVRAMRRWRVVGVLAVALTLVSCSGVTGSKSGDGPSRPSACAFVAKLDVIANTVATADVSDPVAFKATLTKAVSQYVSNVRELRAVAPADLQDGLERVEADVQQFRFEAALTDRSGLDAFAQRECGRVVGTVTSTSGPAAATGSTTSSTSGG